MCAAFCSCAPQARAYSVNNVVNSLSLCLSLCLSVSLSSFFFLSLANCIFFLSFALSTLSVCVRVFFCLLLSPSPPLFLWESLTWAFGEQDGPQLTPQTTHTPTRSRTTFVLAVVASLAGFEGIL